MKKHLWSMAMFVLVAMLSVSLSSCGDDDGNEPTDVISNQDPEGTIVLNMNNGYKDNWYNIGLWSDIHIDDANNFKGYNSVEFVSVGKVSGLSKITTIPSSGWSASAAVVPGTGYVARYNNTYARIYVIDYIVDTTGGIIGATIKYQCPFQLPISLSSNSLTFTSEASSQTVSLKNPTNITVEEKPEWCTVSTYANDITVSVTENLSAKQYTGTIILKNNIGTAKLNVTQKSSTSPKFEGGRGTIDDPYQVKTATQLENISSNLTCNFVLTADINLKSHLNPNGSGWDPIGKSGNTFTGTFDGQGHTISGIWIKRPTTDYAGLFGCINNATINGIKLIIDSNGINGNDKVGGICGYSEKGNIKQCSVNGLITGTGNVGGVCGYGRITNITECYSEGNITSSETYYGYDVSGISHMDGGNISNCYSSASLTSNGCSYYAIGRNASSCYFAGKINNPEDYHFICDGAYTYFDNDVVKINNGRNYSNARTTAQMKTQSNYEGWDFNNTWKITEGKTYPTLRCFDK